MRSMAQLTAGARRAGAPGTCARAAPEVEDPPPPRPATRGSARPVMPEGSSREALLRLAEAVGPRLCLCDKALRALRLIAGLCPWSDFTDPARDPVCFRQQRRLAAELGVSPGHFRRLEAQLERAGMIERATCENGHRGRLGAARAPGAGGAAERPGAVVAGLSLAPLIAGLPRWRAIAEEMAAERAALEEGRARICIERRAARRAVAELAEAHPARRAYEALRGARFPASGGYRDPDAIEAHLAALRAVVEAAWQAAREAEEEAEARAAQEPDHAIWSGAALDLERRHTERTTESQTESCSQAAGREAMRAVQTAEPADAGRACREEGEAAAGSSDGWEGRTTTKATPEASRRPGSGTPRQHPARPPSPGLGSRLPPALLARLTPRALRAMASEEMRLYVDFLHPRPDGSAAPPTLRALEEAARRRRLELGVSASAWDEAEASLGWFDALVALIVVDANRRHPTAPVHNPGGLLRDLARRQKAGALDLGASVVGLWRREAAGA